METALQKPSNSELIIARQLYQQHWALAFAEVMDIIGQRWKLTLYQRVDGQPQPAPLLVLWRDSLNALSPSQMRDGLRLYMSSENGHFEPSPGDIIANAPTDAADRPRKLKNPNCRNCRGTGYRAIEIESKIHPGEKTRAVADCYCVRVEYAGKEYAIEPKQLPPAPGDAKRAELIEQKIADVARGKRMPSVRQPSDEELARRRQEMLNDLERSGLNTQRKGET